MKQTWVDGSGGGTPVSAARLNYIEDGIVAAEKPAGFADVDWVPVTTFTNGWSALSAVAYMRRSGIVFIRGRLTGGTSAVAFTLPAGFRPAQSGEFACASGTTTVVRVSMNSAGEVIPPATYTPNLEPIHFPAA